MTCVEQKKKKDLIRKQNQNILWCRLHKQFTRTAFPQKNEIWKSKKNKTSFASVSCLITNKWFMMSYIFWIIFVFRTEEIVVREKKYISRQKIWFICYLMWQFFCCKQNQCQVVKFPKKEIICQKKYFFIIFFCDWWITKYFFLIKSLLQKKK